MFSAKRKDGFDGHQPLECRRRRLRLRRLAIGFALGGLMQPLLSPAQVIVAPTLNTPDLQEALNATGLTILSVSIENGVEGQFGTFSNFWNPPVRIGDGVVLSSGHVGFMVPPADPRLEDPQPSFDNVQGGTLEFTDYGPNHIENFQGCYDVAVLRVDFEIEEDSQIKFDIVFGTVEYPFYTSSFTDAFLVFLDGTDPANQITFDDNGNPVQVGDSFAGLESTLDQNTCFADPHAVLPRLTTTSPVIESGQHTLLFEVGDVNDGILDSAAFIANLRSEIGDAGTEPSDDLPGDFDRDGHEDIIDFHYFVECMSEPAGPPWPTPPISPEACLGGFDGDEDGDVDLVDYAVFACDFQQSR